MTPSSISSPEPEPGDILLFAHARGLNRLITWFTHSQYYHVAIYAGAAHVIEARPQGVVRRDLRGPEGTHYAAVLPAPGGKGTAALAWAEGQIGAGYDRWDLLVILLEHLFRHLHLNYTPRGKFSCGEFVAEAFRHAGVDLFPGRESSEIVPADFARLLPAGIRPRSLV